MQNQAGNRRFLLLAALCFVSNAPAAPQNATAATNGPQIKWLLGHANPTTAVAFSRDGKQVASSDGREVKIWDAQTGDLVREWKEQLERRRLFFSPDGATLFSTGANRFNATTIATGRTRQILQIAGEFPLAPNADGTLVAAPGEKSVRLFDGKTGLALREWPELAGAKKVDITPDGSRLAAMGDDWLAFVATAGDTPPLQLGEGGAKFKGLAFSPDGAHLAVLREGFNNRNSVLEWRDGKDGQILKSWEEQIPISAPLTLSNDLIVVWKTVFDPKTGEKTTSLGEGGDNSGNDFSPDGRFFARAGFAGAEVWDVAQRRLVWKRAYAFRSPSRVYFSSDGSYFGFSSQNFGFTWKLDGQSAPHSGNGFYYPTSFLTRDGWSGSVGSSKISLENPETGEKSEAAFVDMAQDAQISPDGEKLLVFVEGMDSNVTIWSLHPLQKMARVPELRGGNLKASWAPDGKSFLVLGRAATLQGFDATTGKAVGPLVFVGGKMDDWRGTAGESFALQTVTPDGRFVLGSGPVANGRYGTRIWDAVTGNFVRDFEAVIDADNLRVAFSPSGDRLARARCRRAARWPISRLWHRPHACFGRPMAANSF